MTETREGTDVVERAAMAHCAKAVDLGLSVTPWDGLRQVDRVDAYMCMEAATADMRAELTSLRAMQGERTDWQTMESAPKDGKPFVAWSVTIMDSFDEDDRLIERGVRVEAPCIVYWFSIQGLPGGQFVESPYRSHVSNREFTHWLPLPPSPIPSPSGQEGGDV